MSLCYIAATGAGAGAQNALWRVPGCSKVFAGATFPYGRAQLANFLGFEPEQFCSRDTAIHMAMMAYYTAWEPGADVVGIGLSAAVASALPRRGENRIHGAMVIDSGVYALTIALDHDYGKEARKLHGDMADDLILQLLANDRTMRQVDTERATELFLERGYWSRTGERLALPPEGRAMFPGAFNPPHQGHYAMAAEHDPVFWIEAQAPNKPPVPLAQMIQRAKMLKGRDRYFSSGAQLYTDKARKLPGRKILVGADAVVRMFDPKWGPTPEEVAAVFRETQTTLVIAGRLVGDEYVSGEDAVKTVPLGVSWELIQAPRLDISSSQLRG